MMTGVPLNKRPNDVFVSYAHTDYAVVAPLVKWLRDVAGLRVWWDADGLIAGDRLAASIPEGLASSRIAVFCVSRHWNASTWCEDEYNAALQERRADRRYRVLALHLDDCKVPAFLANARYLEMPQLEAKTAVTLLKSFVLEPSPWSHGERDVYFSRSWHADDMAAADRICVALVQKCGFRLIGDSPDYAAFAAGDRVRRIIESCGALVAVFPFREDPANGNTSKWIVQEVQTAREIGHPYLLFAAEGVKVDPDLMAAAIGGQAHPSCDETALTRALDLLEENYRPAPRLAYGFFATSLRGESRHTNELVALVEHVTCMQCLLGQRLQGQFAQQEITERIQNAQFVLADISANHLNSLIEAGIARGAGTRLHLICKRPDTGDLRTRFMFRDLEVNWYDNPVERIGVVHRVARLYRRRVFVS